MRLTIDGPSRIPAGAAPVALTATAQYTDGSGQDVTTRAAWSSSATAVATVSATGQLTAVAEGSAGISAAFSGLAASLPLTVTHRLLEVTGNVREAYGERPPVPGAVVTVTDGPDAGASARTNATGTFVLSGLTSDSFGVSVAADDFRRVDVHVTSGVVAPIALQPNDVILRWQGVFASGQPFRYETNVVSVRHAGWAWAKFHTDCQAGDSEVGPLFAAVRDPRNADPVTNMIVVVMSDMFTRDLQHQAIISPGAYNAEVSIGVVPGPPGCGWSIEVGVPR